MRWSWWESAVIAARWRAALKGVSVYDFQPCRSVLRTQGHSHKSRLLNNIPTGCNVCSLAIGIYMNIYMNTHVWKRSIFSVQSQTLISSCHTKGTMWIYCISAHMSLHSDLNITVKSYCLIHLLKYFNILMKSHPAAPLIGLVNVRSTGKEMETNERKSLGTEQNDRTCCNLSYCDM